jgi:hypothetical protein
MGAWKSHDLLLYQERKTFEVRRRSGARDFKVELESSETPCKRKGQPPLGLVAGSGA